MVPWHVSFLVKSFQTAIPLFLSCSLQDKNTSRVLQRWRCRNELCIPHLLKEGGIRGRARWRFTREEKSSHWLKRKGREWASKHARIPDTLVWSACGGPASGWGCASRRGWNTQWEQSAQLMICHVGRPLKSASPQRANIPGIQKNQTALWVLWIFYCSHNTT